MEDAAAAIAASMLGETAVADPPQPEVERVEAATETVVEQPAAETVEAAPVATFDLNPELPDDIAAELAEADIDDEVEEAVAKLEPQEDEWGNEIPVDEDAERERIKLRKRNEYLEKRLAQSESGKWKQEAEKFFPLAKHALDDLAEKATSRRRFLKLAEAEHKRILPHVQSYLAEAKTVVDAERDTATTDARKTVAEAWGDPVSGPDTGLTDMAGYEQRIDKARSKGRLADVFTEMLRGPKG